MIAGGNWPLEREFIAWRAALSGKRASGAPVFKHSINGTRLGLWYHLPLLCVYVKQ
jgi:hypothetical protein